MMPRGLGISVAPFGYDPHEETLKHYHADTTGHSGRTFLEHLKGTRQILQDWGMPEHVCIAGLYHSIYGTNIFTVQSAPFEDREILELLIGKKAERLAYLFCVANRPEAFFTALTSNWIRNRHTQEMIRVEKNEEFELLAIEAANHIEQEMGHALVGKIVETLKFYPYLSIRAKQEMLDFSTSARKPKGT
jgi:hypothetical protein